MEQGRLQGTLWGKWWKHKLGPQCTACTCSTLLSYCTPCYMGSDKSNSDFCACVLIPWPLQLPFPSPPQVFFHSSGALAITGMSWSQKSTLTPSCCLGGHRFMPSGCKGSMCLGSTGRKVGATLVSDMNCYSYNLVSVWNRNSDISRIWKCWYWFR